MIKQRILYGLLWMAIFAIPASLLLADTPASIPDVESLKSSLVHLNISKYPYDQFRPWKNLDLAETRGYGCAVGPHQILTTAANVTDAVLIKARVAGQNDYIPCKIQIIDYEADLCLIELDDQHLQKKLTPIHFVRSYRKGDPTEFFWLRSDGEIFSGRGYIDRAEVIPAPVSFGKHLNLIAADISQDAGRGELFFMGSDPIGIGCRQSSKEKEAGIIPAEIIQAFLDDVANPPYQGFATIGFETTKLLDPVQRSYLKLPVDITSGVYVSAVYHLGTGSDVLQNQDVLLGIDDQTIDAYGKFQHPMYQRLSLQHLINSRLTGSPIAFHLWRNGKALTLETTVKTFQAHDMLVPYHEYSKQPEYIITAGFLFQKLTRSYMKQIGDKWYDKISPHLYDYYLNQAFNPSDQRRDIVILSYVLPARINQGYHSLRQIVVKSCNGKTITSLPDMQNALKQNSDNPFDVIEFENDNPIVVIPRDQLDLNNQMIARQYGIENPVHIEP